MLKKIAAVLIVISGFSAQAFAGMFMYEYTAKGKSGAPAQVFGALWEKKHIDGGFEIRGVMQGVTQSVKCLSDGSAYEWKITMKPKDEPEQAEFTAVKNSSGLVEVTGMAGGKPFNSEVDLKGKKWIQDVALQAASFVLSDEQELEFVMVGGENSVRAVEMMLKKKAREKMEIDGKQTEVVRAEMRLSGLLSFMWSAEYVFSAGTGEMLLFKSPDSANPDVTGKLVKKE